jgi:hypothetical protein
MPVSAIAASFLALAGMLATVPASGGTDGSELRFRVTGSVSGLYPGARRSMRVKIRNPFRGAIVVRSVTAQVRRARRACSGSNVEVRPFRGRVRVPARGARVVGLLVRMPATAADECRGARFPLVFRARAALR